MSTRKVTYQHTIEYEVINTSGLFHPQNWALLSVGKIEDARRFVVVGEVIADGFGVVFFHAGVHDHKAARVFDLAGGE